MPHADTNNGCRLKDDRFRAGQRARPEVACMLGGWRNTATMAHNRGRTASDVPVTIAQPPDPTAHAQANLYTHTQAHAHAHDLGPAPVPWWQRWTHTQLWELTPTLASQITASACASTSIVLTMQCWACFALCMLNFAQIMHENG